MIAPVVHKDGLFQLHLCALGQDLIQHPFRQLAAAELQRAGIIFHLGRIGDLSAEAVFLQHQNALAVAQGVKRRRHAGGAAAHYDDIVHSGPSFTASCP